MQVYLYTYCLQNKSKLTGEKFDYFKITNFMISFKDSLNIFSFK